MPQHPQRLSAQQRMALEKQDALFLARPIIADPQMLAAYTRKLVRLLRNRRSASPAADVVIFIGEVFERSVAARVPQNLKTSVACKAGCAYCCTQPVAATPMEALAIAALLRERPETAAAVGAVAGQARATDLRQEGRWVRCPLLADNLCSVYAQRPLSCHSYGSLDLKDCIATFVMLGKSSVRFPSEYHDVLTQCRTVVIAALKICGLRSSFYELNAAVAMVLPVEDAERRWQEGEDVFAGAAALPIDVDWDTKIARFAEQVAPTL